MRWLAASAFAIALGAGGASRGAGPAWPKSAGTVEVTDPAEDGGESLEQIGRAHV